MFLLQGWYDIFEQSCFSRISCRRSPTSTDLIPVLLFFRWKGICSCNYWLSGTVGWAYITEANVEHSLSAWYCMHDTPWMGCALLSNPVQVENFCLLLPAKFQLCMFLTHICPACHFNFPFTVSVPKMHLSLCVWKPLKTQGTCFIANGNLFSVFFTANISS